MFSEQNLRNYENPLDFHFISSKKQASSPSLLYHYSPITILLHHRFSLPSSDAYILFHRTTAGRPMSENTSAGAVRTERPVRAWKSGKRRICLRAAQPTELWATLISARNDPQFSAPRTVIEPWGVRRLCGGTMQASGGYAVGQKKKPWWFKASTISFFYLHST